MMLKKRQDVLTAMLIDFQSRKTYYFTVNETKEKGNVFFGFDYDYTYDWKSFNKKSSKNKYSLTQDSVRLDSGVENWELQVYKNAKRTKLKSKISIEGKKQDNLFSAFEYCCVHPHRFDKEEKPKNLLVTKTTETTLKGQLINYELKTLKEVNFQLAVPKESRNKY